MLEGLNFVERLTEQMVLRGLDAKDLSEEIHVARSTISHWKTGKFLPSTEDFFALLELFQCSADYLLGTLDFPPENVVYYPPLRAYGEQLRSLLKSKGVSQRSFQNTLAISSNLLYRWLTNQTIPNVVHLLAIAHYFDISVDILIQRVK